MVTTISVREEVKKILEDLKGEEDWSSFLEELVEEYVELKREKVRRELKELFEGSFEEVKVRKWAREY